MPDLHSGDITGEENGADEWMLLQGKDLQLVEGLHHFSGPGIVGIEDRFHRFPVRSDRFENSIDALTLREEDRVPETQFVNIRQAGIARCQPGIFDHPAVVDRGARQNLVDTFEDG